MSEFVKPTRKTVSIRDAFSELIGKDLVKDLHDGEEICPVCHGTGLCINDNVYGLSDDPDKKVGHFPYRHQSLGYCRNCYNGVVRRCQYCGKLMPRGSLVCDCDAVKKLRAEERARKERETLAKAEKHEPDALGSLFEMAQSDFFPNNEGYFREWNEFFEAWDEEADVPDEKPLYVWGTNTVEMHLDASDIVSLACEDLYEDAYSDIGTEAIEEMQKFLDEWKKKNGRTSYVQTSKHAIRIPWEEHKEETE